LNKRFVLEKTLQKKINEKEGLEKILKKLEIRATFSGKIYFSDNFREKQYINKKEPVFVLYDNTDYRIIGFCNENDFKLLKENSKSKFIFSSGDIKDIHSNITIISKISVPYLEYPELSSEYKGEIATRLENKKMRTEQAYYKVMIELDEKNLNLRSRETGTLVSQGESSSIITKVFKKAVSVFIRESEF
jgi:putative peptide zinc metalloprotease protein